MNLILTLQETKEFLKVDYEDEDTFIQSLIEASEQYLKNATGRDFDSNNQLAKLYCRVLINDWFRDRSLTITGNALNVSDKVKYTLQSILMQLSCGVQNG
ncbi:head-tail connector protein [Clostridium botulinum]|uniref:head-tail connector protein n=1 Tax=Clostridium botulinum TaxID=1491 RepID=UPI001FAAC0A3|nr:head-tail connector protein [Clostridium botulinum]